ncbi:hypothetical protein BXQ17_01685 [Polaribacter sp. BM10]|uniref:hypothetical protein n=1 Tax=Polaribacter sp. BM10 TaxID=1529069 RepID=UPI00098A8587|nr:hypothetical protein [Polaribacter sp. BM10]AQS92854.1 hypothetical protein BXQ17_01685 [Polaribacter sp. BM10]
MKNLENKIVTSLAVIVLTTSITYAQEEERREKPKGPPSIAKILKDLDVNEDGKISLKEAKGPLKKDFKKIDTNEDGFLSKKELKNAPKPERRERPRN